MQSASDTGSRVQEISAFFRDIRIKVGSTGPQSNQALSFLSTFFEHWNYLDCNTDQLLGLADLAVRAKNEGIAAEALLRVVELSEKSHLAYYRLGRLDLGAKRNESASRWFMRGMVADPEFPPNWMGQARALHALQRLNEAIPYAERFAQCGVRPQSQEDFKVLLELGDALFEQGERQRSGAIYGLLQNFAPPNARVAVRRAEALIAAGEYAEALAVLRGARETVELDEWGLRALAHCESQAGNHAAAVSLAESVLAQRPGDAGFLATYLDALIRSRNPATWSEALARNSALLPVESAKELQARLHLAEGDIEAAGRMLDAVELRAGTRLFWLGLETAYAAIATNSLSLASALAARLQAVAGDEIASLLLQATLFMRQQLWDRSAEILGRVPPHQEHDPDVMLKRFELACFLGNQADAARLRAELETAASLPRQATLSILRYLAEQQNWPELVDTALGWLGLDFLYEQIGYVLFRAVRRTRRHAEFLAAIESIGGWQGSAELQRLYAIIAWDRAGTLAEMDEVADILPANPTMRHRMAVQRDMMARAKLPAGRRAMFLCTDAAYLCATIVAMHSALERSRPGREDVFIVVDHDVAKVAGLAVDPFRQLGYSVTIVTAEDVVGSAEKLYPEYGLFTSGHKLSSAAYYRIYFPRYLEKLGGYGRAIYLDGDVLVRRKLDDLFEIELAGHPLAARLETPRPEVLRAIALHGLEEGQYFNSGVLLFDLTHNRLPHALDAAVAAIVDDEIKLLFHDQCALNLGFRSCFQPLDMSWNTPIAEDSAPAQLAPEAAVLHFLDRPKPWSPAYDGPCAALWLDQWARTGDVIGAALAMELLGLAGD